jgi:iron(III) transport system ATP-binding protein
MLTVESLTVVHTLSADANVVAVDALGFEVPQGRFFTLLGPSGCGKTTTLRAIAGLVTPDAGEIALDGAVLHSSTRGVSVPPHRRRIGMVFQSYATWPHMSVFENVAFPLRVGRARAHRNEIDRRVNDALATVQLGALAERAASGLSGGQQQRLALARAIVMQPVLLLLDEPLSSLDARLREQMRFELKRLQRELRITTVYVTHDQSEALALSHLVAVMENGRIRQVGAPRELYDRPASRFVADFLGGANFLSGRVAGPGTDGAGWTVQTAFGTIDVAGHEPIARDEAILLCVRPEDIRLSESKPEGSNVWRATVSQKVFLGDVAEFRVRLGDVIVQSRTHPGLRTRKGESLWVSIDRDRCIPLSA